ncbi:MAG TPA: hypothetical protein GXZ35_04570 [Acholeplasmataceae bacterium]|nr:hypothetical protein [Acholeplasmataceae bacterium]
MIVIKPLNATYDKIYSDEEKYIKRSTDGAIFSEAVQKNNSTITWEEVELVN